MFLEGESKQCNDKRRRLSNNYLFDEIFTYNLLPSWPIAQTALRHSKIVSEYWIQEAVEGIRCLQSEANMAAVYGRTE
jgi:hypothetical protein